VRNAANEPPHWTSAAAIHKLADMARRLRKHRLAVMAALLAAPGLAFSQDPADSPRPATADIRASADGAGPSHLFWLTGDRRGDTIGVIDPLFAAIRFYRVRPGDEPVATRLTALGVCALPVDFRPWRIHHFKRRVVIESMPDPGAAGYAATPGAMRTRMLAVDRGLLARPDRFDAAAATVDTPRWNPADAPQCGAMSKPGHVGTGAPERAVRTSERTIRLANGRAALAPARPLAVRSAVNRLLAARELEPARGFRIVQASEALPSNDGVIRVRSRILAYARGRLAHAWTLRDSELRGKFGQKPVLVLPSGEVLAMGKLPGDSNPFRISSCGRLSGAPSGICEDDSRPRKLPQQETAGRQDPPSAKVKTGISARAIFANIQNLVSYRLSVDTSAMPEACRSAQGCKVGDSGETFVPIRGIRLTRGAYTDTGMPYAQARVPEDVDRLLAASSAQLGRSLKDVTHGARGWPGNLADGTEGDLGVDCSGLIQIAWGGRGGERLTTDTLQGMASPLACSSRLPGPEYLRPGDAIGLRIDTPVHLLNHAVLFAGAMPLDGASDSWLVLESSSGCDGVCWSVYDPAMFDGWGLYRAGGRSDAACVAGKGDTFTPIPYDMSRWTRQTRGR
jgi:hypothetical protein